MSKNLGFTMAEILLSLTIIGVVAAITLPSLMANINERTWNTQRKALYARMSQAIAMMPQVGGYGTLTEDESGSVTADTAAETFLTEGLSKVLKINNICDSEHLADCGIPASYVNMEGSTLSLPKDLKNFNAAMVSASRSASGYSVVYYSQINTKAAAFETGNGESVELFYNPYCIEDNGSENIYVFMQPRMCANFIFDMNGNKGPNTIGKDMGFMTVFYPKESLVVAPDLHEDKGIKGLSVDEGSAYCSSLDTAYRLPNAEEAAAMYLNKKLIGSFFAGSGWVLTSKKLVVAGEKKFWAQSMYSGCRVLTRVSNGTDHLTRCVKR